MRLDYQDHTKQHYIKIWGYEPQIFYFDKGPAHELPHDFRILEFPPAKKRSMWTYATCCMSNPEDLVPIELHLFSSVQDEGLIELLTAVAHYHRTGAALNWAHTVNFGRSWQGNSDCIYGLISLPYLDGPNLENMVYDNKTIKFYWLIPITESEVAFKKLNGIEALEEKFDKPALKYLDSNRPSVV